MSAFSMADNDPAVRLVMLGMPGAGKGTQAKLLAERLQVPHISTGAMFREEMARGTELGQEARRRIDAGNLVSDAVTVAIVRQRLQREDCGDGFILDGFPRTVAQAEALDQLSTEIGKPLDKVVHIDIGPEESALRISQRQTCQQCGSPKSPERSQSNVCRECGGQIGHRSDDTEETARRRVKVYVKDTHPLIAWYQQKDLLISVDGEAAIDDVFQSIWWALRRAGLVTNEVAG